VRDGEDGYFVECGDVDELIQKIGNVLGCFVKAKELGEQGRKSYRDLFLAKKELVASAFYINVVGFLSLYNISHKLGIIKTYMTDQQVQLKNISID
jgi:hypothetical protein